MDIVFGYIEGLTDIDTPYFASQAEQEDYFTKHTIRTINTSFYPPHYTNRIIVDTEDIELNVSINYCWFEYNYKFYYYFIDSIEYISEDTLAINIRMDVIQTYMFNIYLSSGIIERKHINRYIQYGTPGHQYYGYNRNYIRENVSNGDFILDGYEIIKTSQLYLVIKVAKEPGNNYFHYQTYVTNPLTNDNITETFVPYAYFMYPIGANRVECSTSQATFGNDLEIGNMSDIIEDPNVLEMYVVRHKIYNFDKDGSTWIYSGVAPYQYQLYRGLFFAMPTLKEEYNVGQVSHFRIRFDIEFDAEDYIAGQSDIVDLPFNSLRITSINLPWSERNEPSLVDENYYRVTYGDTSAVSTCSLYKIEYSELTLYQVSMIDDGCYAYYIQGKYNYGSNAEGGIALSNLKGYVPLINDPWKEYQANNAARWAVATFQAAKNIISLFVGAAGKASYVTGAVNSVRHMTNMSKGKIKSERLTTQNVTSYSSRNYNRTGDIIDGAVGSATPLIEQGLADYNAMMKPVTTRGPAEFANSLLSLDYLPVYKRYKVNDLIQCGRYFYMNGNKVNEFVTDLNNIFAYVNTRFYFNMLKFGECNIHLHNIIENETDVAIVEERLLNGVRIWNVYPEATKSANYSNVSNGEVLGLGLYARQTRYTPIVEVISPTSGVTVSEPRLMGAGANRGWVVDVTNTLGSPVSVVLKITYYPILTIGKYEYDNVEKDFID